MATPTFTHHVVPGILGDILVDVRAGGRASPRPAVVMLHGFKGFKDWGMWPPLADRLARAGFAAVTLNFSGSGVDDPVSTLYPERFGHNTFSAELDDLRRVLDGAVRRGGSAWRRPSARAGGPLTRRRDRDPPHRAAIRDPRPGHLVRDFHGGAVAFSREKGVARGGLQGLREQRTERCCPLFPDVLDDIEHHAASWTSRRRPRGSGFPGCSCTEPMTSR